MRLWMVGALCTLPSSTMAIRLWMCSPVTVSYTHLFPALESLKFLAGSCTVHIAYYLCIAVAYRNVDMSFAYTIMRGTAPLLTSVFMLLSGHEMPLAGWLGILCLCAGVLTLTRDNIKNGKFNINGALAAVGTAVVIMGYTLFDGYGARAVAYTHLPDARARSGTETVRARSMSR